MRDKANQTIRKVQQRLCLILLGVIFCLDLSTGFLLAQISEIPETEKKDDFLTQTTETFLASPQSLKNPFESKLPKEIVVPSTASQHDSHDKPLPVSISTPKFVITGVVWNTSKPQVIINGQVASIGDVIENWKIIEIKKTHVKVVSDGTTYSVMNNFNNNLAIPK